VGRFLPPRHSAARTTHGSTPSVSRRMGWIRGTSGASDDPITPGEEYITTLRQASSVLKVLCDERTQRSTATKVAPSRSTSRVFETPGLESEGGSPSEVQTYASVGQRGDEHRTRARAVAAVGALCWACHLAGAARIKKPGKVWQRTASHEAASPLRRNAPVLRARLTHRTRGSTTSSSYQRRRG